MSDDDVIGELSFFQFKNMMWDREHITKSLDQWLFEYQQWHEVRRERSKESISHGA